MGRARKGLTVESWVGAGMGGGDNMCKSGCRVDVLKKGCMVQGVEKNNREEEEGTMDRGSDKWAMWWNINTKSKGRISWYKLMGNGKCE